MRRGDRGKRGDSGERRGDRGMRGLGAVIEAHGALRFFLFMLLHTFAPLFLALSTLSPCFFLFLHFLIVSTFSPSSSLFLGVSSCPHVLSSLSHDPLSYLAQSPVLRMSSIPEGVEERERDKENDINKARDSAILR